MKIDVSTTELGSLENPALKDIKSTGFEEEFTTESTVSDMDSSLEGLPARPVRQASSDSRGTGPRWVYGTSVSANQHSVPSRPSSSRSNSSSLVGRGAVIAVAQPEMIQDQLFPITEELGSKILNYRHRVADILTNPAVQESQNPLLVVTGPTYINDFQQIKACSQWIGAKLGKKFTQTPLLPDVVKQLYGTNSMPQNLLLSIRSNLTKYNFDTSDPSLKTDRSIMTLEIEQGVPVCRALLCELAEVCPIVGETSDTITPQYFSDLFSLGLVSSTLIESQIHRELVSGVSYSVGYTASDSDLPFSKDMYLHKVTSALDAMYASSQPHHFLSITKIGTVAVIGTVGNDETFIILSINSELSFEDLNEIIKKVYLYPKANYKAPKIMLDVGKLSNSNYSSKLSLVKELLQHNDTKYKILGVLVDSGDNYVPAGFTVDLTEIRDEEEAELYDINEQDDHQKLLDMQKYFVHRRMKKNGNSISSSMSSSSVSLSSLAKQQEEDLDKYYEYFLNADKFIYELDSLSKCRIEVNSK